MLKQYGTGISLMLLDIVMPVMNGFDGPLRLWQESTGWMIYPGHYDFQ